MARAAALVTALNEALRGSPYLLPNDEEGEDFATFVEERLVTLEARVKKLHVALAHERLQLETVVRQVYESNALEGLGPSLQQTYSIVAERQGHTLDMIVAERMLTQSAGMVPVGELADVTGLQDAYTFAHELANSPAPPREIDLRNLHALIMGREHHAGAYKQIEVRIAGSSHEPTQIFDVQRQMHELVSWIVSTTAPPALLATVAHAWLTHIHPFQDGNGRTARLLVNLLLARRGYPPLIVKSRADRGEYLESLARSDEGGDLSLFFSLVIKGLHRGCFELESPDVSHELLMRDLFGEDAAYHSWNVMLGSFALDLKDHLERLGCPIRLVGDLGPSDFRLLQQRNPGGNGWWAKVVAGSRTLLLWFGFSSIEMRDNGVFDTAWPSLFFSERDGRPLARHPYRRLSRADRLGLEELTFVPDGPQSGVFVRGGSGLGVERLTTSAAARNVAQSIVRYSASRDLR
jgi:hypothetical protein